MTHPSPVTQAIYNRCNGLCTNCGPSSTPQSEFRPHYSPTPKGLLSSTPVTPQSDIVHSTVRLRNTPAPQALPRSRTRLKELLDPLGEVGLVDVVAGQALEQRVQGCLYRPVRERCKRYKGHFTSKRFVSLSSKGRAKEGQKARWKCKWEERRLKRWMGPTDGQLVSSWAEHLQILRRITGIRGVMVAVRYFDHISSRIPCCIPSFPSPLESAPSFNQSSF